MISSQLYSLECERHFIGGLLKNPQIFPDVDNFIQNDDFVNELHRVTFSIIKDSLIKNERFDNVIIAQKVKNLNINFEDDIDVFSYIESLFDTQITAKATIDAAKELLKLRIRREICATAKTVNDFVKNNGNLQIDELIAEADKIYNAKINSYSLTDEPEDLFETVKSLMLKIAQNPKDEVGLITPFNEFNRLYGGIRKGNGVYSVVSRPKHGKALEENTLIPVPTGWKKIKDLNIGDEVFAIGGSITKITNIKRWENRQVFKVKTKNKHYVIADSEHEWLVRINRRVLNKWKILTTKEINNKQKIKEYKRPMMLPLAGALNLPSIELPIDPYILGIWLGDGTSSNGGLTARREDGEHYQKEAIKRGYKIRYYLYTKFRHLIVGIQKQLRLSNLLNNKHIPEIYLRSSIQQRRDLLKGLMDTDGYIDKKGQCEFCVMNRKLAKSFLELIISLGIKASIHTGRAKLYKNKCFIKDCGVKYRVLFYDNDCVSLPRKKILQKKFIKKKNLYIKVRKLNKLANTVCIEIDHPSHIFLCGRAMMPTHNSSFLLNIASSCALLNKGLKVLILDSEMSKDTNQYRIASCLTQIPMWYFETGNWIKNIELTEKFNKHIDKLDDYVGKVQYLRVANKPIQQICSIIRRWYYKNVGRGNPALVIYDYIKLAGEKLSNNWAEYQAVGDKVNQINELGANLDIQIFVAMQMNRSAENKTDDSSAVAVTDRLQWFCAFNGIFRRKRPDEITEDGFEFGTHKLIELATRFQGKDATGYNNLINVSLEKKKFDFQQNFINYNIENFNIEERGTLQDIINKKREKYDMSDGTVVDDAKL